MNEITLTIFACAYIVGLLFTALIGIFPHWLFIPSLLGILGLIIGFVSRRFWRAGPQIPVWLAAGIVGASAVIYFQLRLPQPAAKDVSLLLPEVKEPVTIVGTITEPPLLNRKQKVRFILEVESVNGHPDVSGKLYVSLPLLQGTGLVPRQRIVVEGLLYLPPPAKNPGGFDFQGYLAREGVFAGLTGNLSSEPETKPWGWWWVRQRLVRSQTRFLGSPAGPLLSSIVLGKSAVDLPLELQDRFRVAGLSHVLAASGFQVTLLLGVMVNLTRHLQPRQRLSLAVGSLLIYLALTGVEASVLRATVMGIGTAVGLTLERQVKPLGLLLFAATFLLIFNPLYIWDLGFQLSFLATFGLITTVEPITKGLDWLWPVVANTIAVPLAASLWTFPLLIYVFKTIATYSILVNILVTPLIGIISLAGMADALVALIFPLGGSAIAWLLFYPISALIWLVEWINQLPGSTLATGSLNLGQLMIIFGLFVGVWLNKLLQKRLLLVIVFCLSLLLIPILYTKATLVKVTVLAADRTSIIIIQDRGRVSLINAGDEDTFNYTIAPFLYQGAVNRLNLAFAFTPNERPETGWNELLANFPVKTFLAVSEAQIMAIERFCQVDTKCLPSLQVGQEVKIGAANLEIINRNPPLLKIVMGAKIWLFSPSLGKSIANLKIKPQILVWPGQPLEAVDSGLEAAIATSSRLVSPTTLQQFRIANVPLYLTSEDGAIEWQPGQGFQASLKEQGS